MADKADKKKESELDKARGQTESQKQIDQYNRSDFQTTDPVTGEERGPTGGTWQDADNLPGPIGEERTPDELKAAQKEEVKRSADAGTPAPRAARKTPAKKSGRKSR